MVFNAMDTLDTFSDIQTTRTRTRTHARQSYGSGVQWCPVVATFHDKRTEK